MSGLEWSSGGFPATCLSSSPSFRARSLSDLAAGDSLSRVVFDSLIGFCKEAKGQSELSEQT